VQSLYYHLFETWCQATGPDTAAAQLRWDFKFVNSGLQTEEARFRIALPSQTAVNGVTLWIDDEPREAAFGGTSVVREAYRKVAIVQRRDPLLVTWAGPDEVFVQCFPIPAQGRECIRLSIAAPSLVLPRITEHNFGRSLEPVLALAPHQTLLHSATVSDGAPSITATRSPIPAPRELLVVVDGSEWMKPPSRGDRCRPAKMAAAAAGAPLGRGRQRQRDPLLQRRRRQRPRPRKGLLGGRAR